MNEKNSTTKQFVEMILWTIFFWAMGMVLLGNIVGITIISICVPIVFIIDKMLVGNNEPGEKSSNFGSGIWLGFWYSVLFFPFMATFVTVAVNLDYYGSGMFSSIDKGWRGWTSWNNKTLAEMGIFHYTFFMGKFFGFIGALGLIITLFTSILPPYDGVDLQDIQSLVGGLVGVVVGSATGYFIYFLFA